MTKKIKFPKRKVHLGVVGVDSGQLVICDPCYIESEFKLEREKTFKTPFSNHPIYKHTDGSEWQFTYNNLLAKGEPKNDTHVPGVNAFPGSYADVIPQYGKCPNDLIQSGDFTKSDKNPFDHVPSGEFSYDGISALTLTSSNQGGQLNYNMGHAGAGVCFSSGWGDGCYDVIAEIVDFGEYGLHGERVTKVTIELIPEKSIKELEKELNR